MDARRLIKAAVLVAIIGGLASAAHPATYKTPNFVVTAPTQPFAEQVGKAAEYYRHHLAIEWLGKPLPAKWSSPCPIHCKVGQIGAGGATTFSFHNGEVFGWRMNIQGTRERILDSVLPHEVSHMIFASHFRCPLPRWADEGGATLVEHESERLRQTKLLGQVIRTSRRIPLSQLLTIKEYPQDMQNVLTLYAEGYSLADFLVQQKGDGAKGKQLYLRFLGDALKHGWEQAFRGHYGFASIGEVEQKWTGWVMAGSPPLTVPEGEMLARTDAPEGGAQKPDELVIRSQNPSRTSGLNPLPKLLRQRRATDGSQLKAPTPYSLAVGNASVGRISNLSETPTSSRADGLEIRPTATRPEHRESRPTSASSRPAEWIGFPTPVVRSDGIRLGPAPPDGGSRGLYSP